MNGIINILAKGYERWMQWPNQQRTFASATLKWGSTLLLIWLVSYGADLQQVWHYMQQVGPERFILAILLLNCAIFLNILRLRLYYNHEDVQLSVRSLGRLTYASLGYSLLLPGGIMGDAYKIMMLKQRSGLPMRQGTKLHLQHRANGLFALMIITSLLFALLPLQSEFTMLQRLLPALCMAIICTAYFILSPLLLREKIPTALSAMPYSFAGHCFNMAAGTVIILALVPETTLIYYLFLIMLSAIVTLLPISVGGLGLRELTFLCGSNWLSIAGDIDLNPEVGVAIALCFFSISAITALLGLIWVNITSYRVKEL